MYKINEIENTILKGDVYEKLKMIPDGSVDLIFADPPYFMQTEGDLLRTEGTKFSGVEDDWDKFSDYDEYDKFCFSWLKECYRVLSNDGAIWVIGAFQNIYRIGYIMQKLNFWVLNDVVWNKKNPAPNFKGTRFTNANETLIWCAKSKKSKYTFNYHTMKYLNGGKQMKSVWNIGLCIGAERLKDKNGKKIHSTQKPEELLLNVILSSSKTGDIVLDPFMGSGTTGAIAKRTGRKFIGVERDENYIKVANKRINKEDTDINNNLFLNKLDDKPPLVSMEKLIEKGYINVGDIFEDKSSKYKVEVTSKGYLYDSDEELSIHKMSAKILKKVNNNGWDYWYTKRGNELISINEIRDTYRKAELNFEKAEL